MKANLLLAAALLLALCLPSARAADGDVETSFTGPSMSSDGGTPGVFGLAVQADGKIVIGGDITSIGGTTRNWLARLNPDGTLDTSFTTIVSGGYPNY